MPSLDENRKEWDAGFDWSKGGDEWSERWGGPEAQWAFTLLPRILKHLPSATILEIAPGFGRWTEFLLGWCGNFIGVDLSPKCVEACRERFRDQPNASFHLTDGYSLATVADASVDFVFSFDSLVHAEWDVISAYLRELARVLTPHGTAFLHHSNLAALPGVPNIDWRATSVSGAKVVAECEALGLSVIGQERVNWGGADLSDCLTTLSRSSDDAVVPVLVDNPDFRCEASHIGVVSRLYCPETPADAEP